MDTNAAVQLQNQNFLCSTVYNKLIKRAEVATATAGTYNILWNFPATNHNKNKVRTL